MAYLIQGFQLVGGPDWIGSERFDVVAKAEGDVPRPVPGGPPGPMFLMVRALLAERFKLAVHNESRELPIYALVLARSDGRLGPQLRVSQVDCAALIASRKPGGPPPVPPNPGERPQCGMFVGISRIAAGGVGMGQVATTLSQRVNRVVVDKTGLTGLYEFELEFTPSCTTARRAATSTDRSERSVDLHGVAGATRAQAGFTARSRRGCRD